MGDLEEELEELRREDDFRQGMEIIMPNYLYNIFFGDPDD